MTTKRDAYGTKTTGEVVPISQQYPFKDTPLALTLTNEIKRVAEQRGEEIGTVIKHLARFTNLTERQIYNYRTGKTQIPENLILTFCLQFRSTALATAWLLEKDAIDLLDSYDLIRLAGTSARNVLKTHDSFLEAFEDGNIDGFEITKLRQETSGAVASFHQLREIAEAHYLRQRVK